MPASQTDNGTVSRETCTYAGYVYWLDEDENVIRRPEGEGDSGTSSVLVHEHQIPDTVWRKLCRNH